MVAQGGFLTSPKFGVAAVSHAVIVNLSADTATQQGLLSQAELDTGLYPTGSKLSDKELAAVNLIPAGFPGNRNYTFAPTNKKR